MATIAEDFWANVQIGRPDECWLWKRAQQTNGYGVFTVKRRQYVAHRHAYELSYGPLTNGQHILHSCDNPPCCNPAHLRAGTLADNMRDMFAKGRHGRHKLTDQARREIRAAYRPNTNSVQVLARAHDVSTVTIYNVLKASRKRA